jgi:hypothetical protein
LIGHKHRDSRFRRMGDQGIRHRFGQIRTGGDCFVLLGGAATDKVHQVLVRQDQGLGQQRQRHNIDVVRQSQGNIVRQMR